MEFAAAAVALVTAASDITKGGHKCCKALRKIKYIHKDIEQYISSAEEFRTLIGTTGDIIDNMIDLKLPALEDDKIKAMIWNIHNLVREEYSLVKDMSRRLKGLADSINVGSGLRKYLAQLRCYSDIKAIKPAIYRFEPVKASITVFSSVMILQLSCQQYKDSKWDGTLKVQKLEKKILEQSKRIKDLKATLKDKTRIYDQYVAVSTPRPGNQHQQVENFAKVTECLDDAVASSSNLRRSLGIRRLGTDGSTPSPEAVSRSTSANSSAVPGTNNTISRASLRPAPLEADTRSASVATLPQTQSEVEVEAGGLYGSVKVITDDGKVMTEEEFRRSRRPGRI